MPANRGARSLKRQPRLAVSTASRAASPRGPPDSPPGSPSLGSLPAARHRPCRRRTAVRPGWPAPGRRPPQAPARDPPGPAHPAGSARSAAPGGFPAPAAPPCGLAALRPCRQARAGAPLAPQPGGPAAPARVPAGPVLPPPLAPVRVLAVPRPTPCMRSDPGFRQQLFRDFLQELFRRGPGGSRTASVIGSGSVSAGSAGADREGRRAAATGRPSAAQGWAAPFRDVRRLPGLPGAGCGDGSGRQEF